MGKNDLDDVFSCAIHQNGFELVEKGFCDQLHWEGKVTRAIMPDIEVAVQLVPIRTAPVPHRKICSIKGILFPISTS